jgi:hypothetical protein
MKATKSGIEINKAELGALLLFAGKADSAVVKFRIDARGKLYASATDGKRGTECEASADGAEKGEWLVPGSYLELLRRGLNKGRTEALLRTTAKGLRDAVLRGAIARDEQQEVLDKSNGTSTQVSMESLHKLVKETPLEGSWFAIVPKHVNRPLDVISKATDGCPVTLYPPTEPTGHVLFAATGDGGTWRGKLQPAAVLSPGGSADEPEADDEDDDPRDPKLPFKGKPAEAATDAGDEGDDSADEDDDGIVDDDYDAEAPAKKKASKKAAKKAPRKGR